MSRSAAVLETGTHAFPQPDVLVHPAFTMKGLIMTESEISSTLAAVEAVSEPLFISVNAPDNTNNATPVISGATNALAGSTVYVNVTDATGKTQNLQAMVAADGSYSAKPASPLVHGQYTVNVEVKDAPNHSASATGAGNVDLVPPAPGQFAVNPSPAGVTVTGEHTEANAQIKVDMGGHSYTAVADAAGKWSVVTSTQLAEGLNAVVVTVTDQAGNSVASASLINVPPATMPNPGVVDAPDNTSDSTPLITGSGATPGQSVNVAVTDAKGDTQSFTVTGDETGHWSITPTKPLAEGAYTVIATVTSGNLTLSSNGAGVVDTTPPGISVTHLPNSYDVPQTISGKTEPLAVIQVTINGASANATSDADGNWSVDAPSHLEGSYTVQVTATDAAGNHQTASYAHHDAVVSAGHIHVPEGVTDETTNILITGSEATPDTVIQVSVGGEMTEVTSDSQGNWSLVVPGPLPGGDMSPWIVAKPVTQSAYVEMDAHPLPVLATPWLPGQIHAPAVTNDDTPWITATGATPGASIEVNVQDSAGGSQRYTVVADSEGNWGIEVAASLANGQYTVAATATHSGLQVFSHAIGQIDTVAPNPGTLTAPDIDPNTHPTITGSGAEPGAQVTIHVMDAQGHPLDALTTTVAEDGTYSVTVSQPMQAGSYTAVATVTDAAGNASATQDAGSIVIPVHAEIYTVASTWDDTTGPLASRPTGATGPVYEPVPATQGNDWIDIGSGSQQNWSPMYQGSIWHYGATGLTRIAMGDGNDHLSAGIGGGRGDMYANTLVDMGSGDDELVLAGGMYFNSQILMGDGNDMASLNGGAHQFSEFHAGAGDDTLQVAHGVDGFSRIEMGQGDDWVSVEGGFKGSAFLGMGDGADTAVIYSGLQEFATVDAGSGNDSVDIEGSIGVGASVYLGAGDDMIQSSGSAIHGHVYGGGGVDTLVTSAQSLSASHLSGIEVISLQAQGLVDIKYQDLLADHTRTGPLHINGDSGDKVDLGGMHSKAGADISLRDAGGGKWVKTGAVTENDITYDVYHHSGAGSNASNDVYIQQGIVVI